jgi:hypothetical protein
MSEVRPVAGSAERRLPREPPKRDDSERPRPQRVQKTPPAEADAANAETHKLNVSA